MAKWKSRYEYEYEVELSRPLFDYPFLFRVSALRVPKSDIMNMKADSLGFSPSVGEPQGSKVSTNNGSFYTTGVTSHGQCLIILPDVWGWHSGRTRCIADHMASSLGCRAIVPALQPPLEGGIDGDGLPADFNMPARQADFGSWCKSNSWESVIRPKMQEVMEQLKADGITSLQVAGFCWGFWATCKLLSDERLLDGFTVKSASGTHPSVQLEERLFDGDTEALCKTVKFPVLLQPTGNDPDEYRENGAYLLALQSAHADSTFTDYPAVKHGFVPRGNAEEDGVHITAAVAELVGWHNKYLYIS